ncbi:MAG: TatD family hydrolase [Brevinemataceae bacterium]
MYIDTHTHLNVLLEEHSNNIGTQDKLLILSNLLSSELELVINISLDFDEFLTNYPIISQSEKVLSATGIYPDRTKHSNYNETEYISKLREVLSAYPHIAIGECGIDLYHTDYGSQEVQESLFRKQIELALEFDLPIIIHSRNSFYECYNILKEYPNLRVIFHCFSYGTKEIELLLYQGYYVSFSGNLTYEKNIDIRNAAEIVPISSVLFETDSPYLSPVPLRGKRNRPEYVKHTYQYFSKLRNIDIKELESIIKENVYKCFNLTK